VCEKIERYLSSVFPGEAVTPVGHNVGFDVAFLRKLAFLGGRNEITAISHRALDTHTMLYLLHLKGRVPPSALSSDGAFEYFGIRVPDNERHTALGDALATRELVLRIFEMLEVP
jgi:DNA polymerase III epsilon subunit-like protein